MFFLIKNIVFNFLYLCFNLLLNLMLNLLFVYICKAPPANLNAPPRRLPYPTAFAALPTLLAIPAYCGGRTDASPDATRDTTLFFFNHGSILSLTHLMILPPLCVRFFMVFLVECLGILLFI
jgi:hypothetical protein